MTLFFDLMLWTLFGVVVISTLSQLALYVSAGIELRRIRSRDRHQLWRRMLASPLAPKITVLVPAYNESVSILGSVNGLLALTYPNLEIVVVNDGSSDATLNVLVEGFGLSPVGPVYRRVLSTERVTEIYRGSDDARLIVVDKENGGKADALNTALNITSGDLVCAIDADTLVATDALQQLVAPFLANDETVAVGGTIRLANDASWKNGRITELHAPRKLLVGAQAAEYARSFLVGRIAWGPLGGNLIISGAFGLFRRSSLLDVGGYEHESIGEDMELIVRLRRHGYETGKKARVEFSPDPVAYTEAPTSLRTLARQRNRWFRGLLDVLSRHRSMIGRPKYGSAGMLALPYFVVVEALSPIVEACGIVAIAIALSWGLISWHALLPVALVYLVGIGASLLVLILDDLAFGTFRSTGDRVRMVGHVLFEQLVFRPLTIVWRLWGLRLFMQGRTEWGAQERHGISEAAAAT